MSFYVTKLGARYGNMHCLQEHHHHHHGWHHHGHPAFAAEDKLAFVDQAATEYCSDVMQLKMCHMKCGHDGLCHQKCPLPKDEDLKAKVVEKMQCHDKCGADRECHQKCVAGGCPFRKVLEKCPMLKFEDPRHLGLSAGKMRKPAVNTV